MNSNRYSYNTGMANEKPRGRHCVQWAQHTVSRLHFSTHFFKFFVVRDSFKTYLLSVSLRSGDSCVHVFVYGYVDECDGVYVHSLVYRSASFSYMFAQQILPLFPFPSTALLNLIFDLEFCA